MFNIFKKEKKIVAPVSGKLMKLSDVKDEVFASGMMGIGVAIDPVENIFVAPADGKITLIAKTKHAFGMQLDNGLEILIHIGLDTALSQGEGFHVLANVGDAVKQGVPIIEADFEFFKNKGNTLETPVIILNSDDYKIELITDVIKCLAGETTIMKY